MKLEFNPGQLIEILSPITDEIEAISANADPKTGARLMNLALRLTQRMIDATENRLAVVDAEIAMLESCD